MTKIRIIIKKNGKVQTSKELTVDKFCTQGSWLCLFSNETDEGKLQMDALRGWVGRTKELYLHAFQQETKETIEVRTYNDKPMTWHVENYKSGDEHVIWFSLIY